jgi:hypothetical protein
LLRDTKLKAKAQKSRDKRTFSGLFKRGEVYTAQELREAKEVQMKNKEAENYAANDRDIAFGRQLVLRYDERGMEAEKANLEKSLEVELRRRDAAARANNIDFRNPTETMVQNAKKMGVDLHDPQTVQLLEQMQKEKISSITSNACLLNDEVSTKHSCAASIHQSQNGRWMHFGTVIYVFLALLSALGFVFIMNFGEFIIPSVH